MTEAELKRIVVEHAHAKGWLVFSMPQNRLVRPVKDAIGFPDLTLARSERVVFIELKQDKGVMSIDQARWFAALPSAFVIRPADLEGGMLERILA